MDAEDTTIDNVYNPDTDSAKQLSALSKRLYTIVAVIIVLVIIIALLTNNSKKVQIKDEPEIIERSDPRTRQAEIKKQ